MAPKESFYLYLFILILQKYILVSIQTKYMNNKQPYSNNQTHFSDLYKYVCRDNNMYLNMVLFSLVFVDF